MNAIINFFVDITELLVSVINFIITIFKSVFWLIGTLPDMVQGTISIVSYAPDFLFPFMVVSIVLLVLLCIIKVLF